MISKCLLPGPGRVLGQYQRGRFHVQRAHGLKHQSINLVLLQVMYQLKHLKVSKEFRMSDFEESVLHGRLEQPIVRVRGPFGPGSVYGIIFSFEQVLCCRALKMKKKIRKRSSHVCWCVHIWSSYLYGGKIPPWVLGQTIPEGLKGRRRRRGEEHGEGSTVEGVDQEEKDPG